MKDLPFEVRRALQRLRELFPTIEERGILSQTIAFGLIHDQLSKGQEWGLLGEIDITVDAAIQRFLPLLQNPEVRPHYEIVMNWLITSRSMDFSQVVDKLIPSDQHVSQKYGIRFGGH